MKQLIVFVVSFSVVSAIAASMANLDGEWTLDAFPQPEDGAVRSLPLPKGLDVRRYQATVPGCCEMELVKAGLLPDPMFSTNAFAFMAYEGHQWVYGKRFAAPPRKAGERQVLVFEGIDTLADVFLNGEKIGEADNMLIPHEFDVTGKVRTDADNLLQVLIRPVGLAAADVLVGQLGHTMEGGADHERFRKAQYMYGWDIMPHLPVSGIWRSVRLETRPAARIECAAWTALAVDRAKRTADVAFFARIVAPSRNLHKASVKCTLSRNGKIAAVRKQTYHGPQTKVRMSFGDVDFWWPCGAGEAALYDARAELIDDDGTVLAADERKFGVRIVKLEYEDRKLPERSGRFVFTINGEPIYVRGINWVPLDPIPSRQAGHLPNVLPMIVDLNCNLVRVWGGGVYEPDAFFDWCDANGVMVWQDFMMGCSVPPQDDEFAEKIRKEALSVVLRFRSHPSLVLWAGDNENDLSAGWGLGSRNRPDPNANRITREVLPRVVREYDVMRPYLPSSPFVSEDAFAGRAEPSEDHLWGGPRAYWKHPYYTNNACWFCSEGGSHALPSRKSLERMMPAADVLKPWLNPGVEDCRSLLWTPQWIYHATNPYLDMDRWGLVHRNDHVLKQAGALFGDVERHDIDTLVAQTQSSQAESIKFQVELFRSQKFKKKGGFVVWNLRDGWPEISDAICDWYGDRKKSYHALKAAYRNVLPIVTEDHRLVVVNDLLKPVRGHVKVAEAATGEVVLERDYEAPANGVLDLAPIAWNGQGVFIVDYTADGETFRTHYLHGEPPFAWGDYVKWTKDL